MSARRAATRSSQWPQTLLGAGYVLGMLALACALAWPLFDTVRLALVAGFAGVAGVGTALAARVLRRPLWQHVLALVVLYLIGALTVAIPRALLSPSAAFRGLLDALTGVVLGWKQLLTLELPVGDYQAVLIPVFALFLVGTAVAAALAITSGRRAALAVPIMLALTLFGIAFGRTDPGEPAVIAGLRVDAPYEVLFGMLAIAASLLWLVLRSRLVRRAALVEAGGTLRAAHGSGVSAASRRRLLAVGILAVALVVGVLAGPPLSGATARETFRTSTEPLLLIQKQPTPLSGYRTAFQSDAIDRVLFTVHRADGGSGVEKPAGRLTIATLGGWDGERFLVSPDERFSRLPSGQPLQGATPFRIDIGPGYSGIWLPLPAGASSAPVFDGPRSDALTDGFYLDRATGSGIEIAASGKPDAGKPDAGRTDAGKADAGTAHGVREGDAYTVYGGVGVEPPLGEPGARSALDLADHPQLAAWVKAQAQPRTAEGFAELLNRLRSRGYLSHSLADDEAASRWIAALRQQTDYSFESSFAGHSTARIETLFRQLVEQQERVGANASAEQLVASVGDDEQFAVAGALLARAVGYDSRVVVGVRLGAGHTGGIPDCAEQCTGANLAAWIEVRAPGTSAGWTSFDVEPQFTVPQKLVSVERQLPQNPTLPEQPQAHAVQPPTAPHDERSATRSTPDAGPEWVAVLLRVLTIAALVVGVGLLLLLPFLTVRFAKRMRRRARRRDPIPEVAVVGAWEELMDARRDAGGAWPTGTRREIADQVGSARLVELATLVDRAVFAENPPGPAEAEHAWDIVEAELAHRRAEAGPFAMIVAALNPASFLRSAAPSLSEGGTPTLGSRWSRLRAIRPQGALVSARSRKAIT